jgi:hypothetical protein
VGDGPDRKIVPTIRASSAEKNNYLSKNRMADFPTGCGADIFLRPDPDPYSDSTWLGIPDNSSLSVESFLTLHIDKLACVHIMRYCILIMNWFSQEFLKTFILFK